MPNLTFPAGRAIGTLGWLGAGAGAAPVLASGVVTVPDGAEISLNVMVIESVRKTDAQHRIFHTTTTFRRKNPDGSAWQTG